MPKSREPVPEPEPELFESIGTEEDEEESSGGEEEEEEEEEDSSDDGKPVAPIQNSTPQKLLPLPSSSEDEDGSDSESGSESDSPIRKPDPSIKPIASKPMTDDPPKSSASKKPRSKAGPTSPTKPGVKRPAEKDSEAKETKKSKKKPDTAAEGGETSEKKPTQLFQRLWSEEDEIVILKGMMDYVAKKKADPVADVGAFLEFIKKSLHVDVSKTQLQDKIRRLKKKYENNASKEKNGKERLFSKPHEQTAYELSKKIWGKVSQNNGNVGKEKVSETPKAVPGSVVRKSRSKSVVPSTPNKFNEVADQEMKDVEVEDDIQGLKKNGSVISGGNLCGVSEYSSLAEWVTNDGMKMVEDAKKEEMEQKWRRIKEKEVELFLEKTELMSEQARLVLEAMRESEH